MKYLILALLLFGSIGALADKKDIFEFTDHCVAWKTKKRMFLVSTVEPVGKNCNVTFSLVSVEGDKIALQGTIPIAKFESGEAERDAEVLKLLGSEKQKELIFESVAMTKQDWFLKTSQSDSYSLGGKLKIAGKDHKVEFQMKSHGFNEGDKGEIYYSGVLDSKFSYFGIKPPTVAGGMVAKVRDTLQLSFHLQLAEIKNLRLLGIDPMATLRDEIQSALNAKEKKE